MQQILSLIFCKGDLWPIHHRPNWARMPWLEHISFQGFLAQWDPTQSRLLTTHLHAKALAPALKKSKARVRNRPLSSCQVRLGDWLSRHGLLEVSFRGEGSAMNRIPA